MRLNTPRRTMGWTRDGDDSGPARPESPPRRAALHPTMLCNAPRSRNGPGRRRIACLLCCCPPLLAALGCAGPAHNLRVWRRQAAFEHVCRFGIERKLPGRQWFARVVDPDHLPRRCVHPLSRKFDFLLLSTPRDWSDLLPTTNLRPELQPPPFDRGIVVGLLARAGGVPDERWPVQFTTARRRGSVAFLEARFEGGLYRPLDLPPHLHLVFLPGVRDVLGIRLNQSLFGFNVEIDELNRAGIH